MKHSDAFRYPVGKYEYGNSYTFDETRRHIRTIAELPDDLKKILKKLNSDSLDKSYRKGGWTARQIVHHLADSSVNAYIRMKLAVTEPTPIIKPYLEANWAETEDGRSGPIKISLKLIAALTKRWEYFLESLSADDLNRGYFHPEMKRIVMLQDAIGAYAWHARHHLAHLKLILNGEQYEPGKRLSYRDEESTDSAPTSEVPSFLEEGPKKRGPKPKLKPIEETASIIDAPKKRGPKPKVAAENGAAVSSEPKKRGPKPKAAAETGAAVSNEPKKRGPKPKAAAETGAAVSSEPKKRGPKPKAASENGVAVSSEPKKRGPKPKAASEKGAAVSSEPKKRGPKPKAAAETGVAVSSEPKKRGPKPKAAAENGAAISSEPKKRGPKPKVAAENGAAVSSEPKKRGPKPKPRPVVEPGTEVPKKPRGRTAEQMAELRAKKDANRLAAGIVPKVKIVDPNAEPKKRGPKPKEKPIKVIELGPDGEPLKKRGQSPEHMANIRAKRMANLEAKKAEAAALLETNKKPTE
jgi:hypothetical protein